MELLTKFSLLFLSHIFDSYGFVCEIIPQEDINISAFLGREGIGRYNKESFQKMLKDNNTLVKKTPAYVTLFKKKDNCAHMFQKMIDAGWMTDAQAKEIHPKYKEFKIPNWWGGNRKRSTQSKKYKKNTKRSKRTLHVRSKRYSRKT